MNKRIKKQNPLTNNNIIFGKSGCGMSFTEKRKQLEIFVSKENKPEVKIEK